VLRGDPLIGQATLEVTKNHFGTSTIQTLQLTRGGEKCHGTVELRAGVRARQDDYRILASARSQSLSEIAASLAAVLSQPKGVDALLRSRPSLLAAAGCADDSALRRTLQAWVVRLSTEARGLAGSDDEAALDVMARLLRSAQQIVVMCVGEACNADDIRALTVNWIRNLFQLCAGIQGLPPRLNEARLQRLLDVTQSSVADPRQRLADMGITLPGSLPEETVAVIVDRLLEAFRSGEEEMFTGERIVDPSGGVTLQLGAVILADRQGKRPHAFLYDLASIRQWQSQGGAEPSTRQAITSRNIIPLTLTT